MKFLNSFHSATLIVVAFAPLAEFKLLYLEITTTFSQQHIEFGCRLPSVRLFWLAPFKLPTLVMLAPAKTPYQEELHPNARPVLKV
jgi:hypothetical protein